MDRATLPLLAAANLAAGALCQMERDGWVYPADSRDETQCLACGYAPRAFVAGESVTLIVDCSWPILPQRRAH